MNALGNGGYMCACVKAIGNGEYKYVNAVVPITGCLAV